MRRIVKLVLTLALGTVAFALAVPAEAGSNSPLTGVAQIDAGDGHTCAVVTGGEVRCAGDNQFGQLGNDNIAFGLYAYAVENQDGTGSLTGVEQVAGGLFHTCARMSNGQARCWGRNDRGQLGDGTTDPSSLPVVVTNVAGSGPLRDVAQIATGYFHTCARLTNGEVRCWGGDDSGEIGDGTSDDDELRPTVVVGPPGTERLRSVIQIAAGNHHTCAVLSTRQARCWGDNGSAQVGDGTTVNRARPVPVDDATGTRPLADVAQLAPGSSHTCARLTSGQVRCWGYNLHGQLGNGTVDGTIHPVVVRLPGGDRLTSVTQLASGDYHSCARRANARLVCWGRNDSGQIGDDTTTDRSRPVVVVTTTGTGELSAVAQVTAGAGHTCARLADGQARCWGINVSGRLSDGSTLQRNHPALVLVS